MAFKPSSSHGPSVDQAQKAAARARSRLQAAKGRRSGFVRLLSPPDNLRAQRQRYDGGRSFRPARQAIFSRIGRRATFFACDDGCVRLLVLDPLKPTRRNGRVLPRVGSAAPDQSGNRTTIRTSRFARSTTASSTKAWTTSLSRSTGMVELSVAKFSICSIISRTSVSTLMGPAAI